MYGQNVKTLDELVSDLDFICNNEITDGFSVILKSLSLED